MYIHILDAALNRALKDRREGSYVDLLLLIEDRLKLYNTTLDKPGLAYLSRAYPQVYPWYLVV